MNSFMMSESLAKEGQEFIEHFKEKMRKAAEETISSIYVDLMPHIESDSWMNYRNCLRNELLSEYGNPSFYKSEGFDAKKFRAMILKENREDIIESLNKDLLFKIKELEAEVEILRRNRW